MPLSEEVRAELDRLRRPGKSAKALFVEARRNGVEVAIGQVREYFRDDVSDKGAEQIAPARPYNGKNYAEDVNARWMADLAIYHTKRQGYVGFLLVVDTFSRALDAEPVKGKSAAEATRAFAEIVPRMTEPEPGQPVLENIIITADSGSEFRSTRRQYVIWARRRLAREGAGCQG